MMVVHASLSLVSGLSLLLGMLVAAGYVFGRRWLRQQRMQGRAALAWNGVRLFEAVCVPLVVFLLATMYAGILGSASMFYLFGGVLTGSFATYRVLTWQRQYEDATDEPPPQDHWR